MTLLHGSWTVHAIEGADVRLRSDSARIMTIDVTAPVTAGRLHVSTDGVSLSLTLALDRLDTRSFMMKGAVVAARSVVQRHEATSLDYTGHGPGSGAPWQVSGLAVAGDIRIDLGLKVLPAGQAHDPMQVIELVGSASIGAVSLPALGRIDDFAFDVDARLDLVPAAHREEPGRSGDSG